MPVRSGQDVGGAGRRIAGASNPVSPQGLETDAARSTRDHSRNPKALAFTERASGLDIDAVRKLSNYREAVRDQPPGGFPETILRKVLKDEKPNLERPGKHLERVILVPDRKVKSETKARPKAEVGNDAHVGAPMPGVVASILVRDGAQVNDGDLLLTLEAMKMETGIHAERDATVKTVHVQPGAQIDAKDLLVEFEK